MGTILAVTCLLGLALAGVVFARGARSIPPLRQHAKWGYPVAVGMTVLAVLVVVKASIRVVEPGNRGLVVAFGTLHERELGEGMHLVAPWAEIKTYNVQMRKTTEKQTSETLDTQSVTVEVILNWRVKPDRVVHLYREIGPDDAKSGIEGKIIMPAVYETVKAEVAKHKVTDLISLRHEIKASVWQNLSTVLAKYDVELLEVAIADIDFSGQYDAAIEAKQVKEQEAKQAEYELTRKNTEAQMAAAEARGRAESRIQQARGEAESVKLSAQAEADALLIRGQAQADFNRLVAQSLTAELIQKSWLERWDGRLPQFMTGGDKSSLMLMLPPAETSK